MATAHQADGRSIGKRAVRAEYPPSPSPGIGLPPKRLTAQPLVAIYNDVVRQNELPKDRSKYPLRLRVIVIMPRASSGSHGPSEVEKSLHRLDVLDCVVIQLISQLEK